MTRLALISCLVMAACSDWPDAGGPTLERRSSDWPALLPLSQLIETGTVSAAEDDEAERLAARAAALRAKAQILRSNAGDADAMEALRARLR